MTPYVFRSYPLTLLFAAMIFVLCLIPVPETPLGNVSMIDKWTHIALYVALEIVLWTEMNRSRSAIGGIRLFAVAVLLPAFMGGMLEIMQEYLTTCRSGDWIDFVADCTGVISGALLGKFAVTPLFVRIRKRRAPRKRH